MHYFIGDGTAKLLLPHMFTNPADIKHQHVHLGYDPTVMTSQEHFIPHIPILTPSTTNPNRHVPK